MNYKNSEIIYKNLREANIVGEIHNLSSFPSSFAITLQRSCQRRDDSGFF